MKLLWCLAIYLQIETLINIPAASETAMLPSNAPITHSGVQRFFQFLEDTCYPLEALDSVPEQYTLPSLLQTFISEAFTDGLPAVLPSVKGPHLTCLTPKFSVATSFFVLPVFLFFEHCCLFCYVFWLLLPVHLHYHQWPRLSIPDWQKWYIEIYDVRVKHTENITVTYNCCYSYFKSTVHVIIPILLICKQYCCTIGL